MFTAFLLATWATFGKIIVISLGVALSGIWAMIAIIAKKSVDEARAALPVKAKPRKVNKPAKPAPKAEAAPF